MLVLDSGGITALADRSRQAGPRLLSLARRGHWPPLVPTVVLAECLTGHPGRDARVNKLVKECLVEEALPVPLAWRAARLRSSARHGSAVDAVVVAFAEERKGRVLTTDPDDLRALAQYADGVVVESV